jgi:hypothetical protein
MPEEPEREDRLRVVMHVRLPDLQRGIHHGIRAGPASPGPDGGSDPAGPRGPPPATGERGGRGPTGPDAAHRRPAGGGRRGRRRMAISCRLPSSIEGCGTARSLRKGWRSSHERWPDRRLGHTRSRPRSPRFTMRRARRRIPTGPRSWPCTMCSKALRRIRW